MSDSRVKFNEWMKKIADSLNEGKVEELHIGCKYLSYWHKKVGAEDPSLFLQLEAPLKKLLRESAMKMLNDGNSVVDEARRHRKNTKIRLTTLTRFIYTYQRYIHPLLIKTRERQLAHDTILAFNTEFLEELVVNAERMSLFQATSTLKYLSKCKGAGLSIRDEYVTIFQDVVIRYEESDKPNLSDYWLTLAETDVARGRIIQAVALMGEALRTFVGFMCTFHGADTDGDYYDAETSFEDRPFVYWLSFLESEGAMTPEEVFEYSMINARWFEAMGEDGYSPPNNLSLSNSIVELRRFIRRNWNEMTSPPEDQ